MIDNRSKMEIKWNLHNWPHHSETVVEQALYQQLAPRRGELIFSFPGLVVDVGVVTNSAPPAPPSLTLRLRFSAWLEPKTLLCNSMMFTSCPQSSSKPPSISSSLEFLDLPRPPSPPPSFPPEAYCDTRAKKRHTPAFSGMIPHVSVCSNNRHQLCGMLHVNNVQSLNLAAPGWFNPYIITTTTIIITITVTLTTIFIRRFGWRSRGAFESRQKRCI